jgi:hypothetical protein
MQGCRQITTASPGTRMRRQRKWKLQQIQNKALRLAIMMRRDSLKSALKACAFTPFCLSTFSAICSLVLAERILPSTLRANMTAEPDNKKHTLNRCPYHSILHAHRLRFSRRLLLLLLARRGTTSFSAAPPPRQTRQMLTMLAPPVAQKHKKHCNASSCWSAPASKAGSSLRNALLEPGANSPT